MSGSRRPGRPVTLPFQGRDVRENVGVVLVNRPDVGFCVVPCSTRVRSAGDNVAASRRAICSATWLCTPRMSESSRSYCSDHRVCCATASTSSTATRTRVPSTRTLPSTRWLVPNPRDGRTVGAAKLIDRAPAQHPQRRDLRELTANLVGHAFREKTLGPILRQVSERPHPYRHRQSPCPQAVPRSAASERSQLAIRFQLAKMRVTTNYFYPLTFSIA